MSLSLGNWSTRGALICYILATDFMFNSGPLTLAMTFRSQKPSARLPPEESEVKGKLKEPTKALHKTTKKTQKCLGCSCSLA